jgi:hypothetical protein
MMLTRAALVVLLSACGTQISSSVIVSPSDARVQRVGHFDTRMADAPRFAWPATEVAFAFEGPSLYVTLTDAPAPDEPRDTDWLSVVLDGKEQVLGLREGRHEYELARQLGPGRHEVRLRKRTEPEVGTITLHGFRLGDGGKLLAPRQRPERHIEVVGDSISTGYGNEGLRPGCSFSARTQDATRTYATIAARELGADVAVAAWSGKGLVENYEREEPEPMPVLFERAVPTDGASPRVTGAVDAFVVNLGANDFVHAIPDERTFIAAYQGVLERLVARSPHAPLVLVLPPLLADDHPQPNARRVARSYLEKILQHQVASGRTAVIVEQSLLPSEGFGCDHHPSVMSHERLGRELAEALRPLLGQRSKMARGD